MFTINELVRNEEITLDLFIKLSLLPSKDEAAPKCENNNCGYFMKHNQRASLKVVKSENCKLKWKWACTKRTPKGNRCNYSIVPTKNTILDNVKIPANQVLAIIAAFIWEFELTETLEHLNVLMDKTISYTTIVEWFSICRQICEVINL